MKTKRSSYPCEWPPKQRIVFVIEVVVNKEVVAVEACISRLKEERLVDDDEIDVLNNGGAIDMRNLVIDRQPHYGIVSDDAVVECNHCDLPIRWLVDAQR